MSEICPHCRLNTAGQHESHCPLGRALNLAMSIQVEPDDQPFPESQPIRPSVEMDRIAALEREVEKLKHQITCDVCAGTGKSTDGTLCACGGSGLIGDLLTYLRRENAELLAKLERAEAASAAMLVRIRQLAGLETRPQDQHEFTGRAVIAIKTWAASVVASDHPGATLLARLAKLEDALKIVQSNLPNLNGMARGQLMEIVTAALTPP